MVGSVLVYTPPTATSLDPAPRYTGEVGSAVCVSTARANPLVMVLLGALSTAVLGAKLE